MKKDYNLICMYYADDNQVFVSFKPNHPSMYNDAEHVFSWNNNTGVLKSNPEEAEVVHFTSRFPKQPSFGESITFAGTSIDIKKKARNLGIFMDNSLSFSAHINQVCKKPATIRRIEIFKCAILSLI